MSLWSHKCKKVSSSSNSNRIDRRKVSQKSISKKIGETKNYFTEETQKPLHGFTLHWQSHILVSAASVCVSISAVPLLVGIHIGIASSTTGLRISAISTGIKTYQ